MSGSPLPHAASGALAVPTATDDAGTLPAASNPSMASTSVLKPTSPSHPATTSRSELSSAAHVTLAVPGERRILAEDSQWNLAMVEPLTTLCVRAIVENFETRPILDGLPRKYRARVLSSISVDLPLPKIVSLIPDDAEERGLNSPGYWRRRTAAHFPDADAARHGGKWKTVYCERTMEAAVAAYVPGRGGELALGALARAVSACVVRLHVDQLLPDAVAGDPNERKATDAHPDHVDPELLVVGLDQLKHVALYYGVKDVGMKFEWYWYGMSSNDAVRLARALRKCAWTHLTLSRCGIDDSKIAALCDGLKDHKALVYLKLDHNKISDTGASPLATVLASPHSRLAHLDLGNNRIGALGAAYLAKALATNTALQTLILRLNPLGNDGAFILAYALLTHHHTLKSLDLAATNMGASALQQVAALVAADAVEALDVSSNAFGGTAGGNGGGEGGSEKAADRDRVVDALGKAVWTSVQASQTLKALDLRVTDLPEGVVRAVQAALQQRATAG
ncbi:hypothetical protein AMAG_05273 [Allomyces macrogynus ATCC 38327]|uniref:RNI-like protein n=1 Tax=Allomyces macrogynus (strain ATCC 38327) TaxID=578462 RepID=A0A0L0SBF7_ALLM3|nr:hypothetical protein AMAG_05273 [Allomyces macrogynus ATCC 38327]|eukprot:KNE59816.1 hypothetical protein AMAG_05273 [Allomyces macrogynus ATCC 38327]